MGASGTGREGSYSLVGPTVPPVPPTLRWACPHPAHLSDLLEALRRHTGEDVALGLAEDLEGHGTVVVLQGRDVIVADGQLRAGVDLVPGVGGESGRALGHPHSEAPSSQGSSAGGGGGEVHGSWKGWRGPHSARARSPLLLALLGLCCPSNRIPPSCCSPNSGGHQGASAPPRRVPSKWSDTLQTFSVCGGPGCIFSSAAVGTALGGPVLGHVIRV